MQTLGARFQMRRVSLEPGRQPEAGMGSQIVERAVGSVAWPAVLCWRWMNYASAHMHVNALMQFFMRTDMHERKSPRLGGLQEGREGLVVELAK
ncbi:hypothetical protein K3Z85_03880 [Pseudomonas aeruginosa]|nr:hypothetical protein [Pseudomonas aeruginosa]MDI4168258.1 hypothetical protein [Pseudomonas aeruginosa]